MDSKGLITNALVQDFEDLNKSKDNWDYYIQNPTISVSKT